MAEDKNARIQFRCTEVMRERAELAAAELEMDFTTYIRSVVEAAVDAHFEDQDLSTVEVPSFTQEGVTYTCTLSGGEVVACECPGWKRLGRCRHAEYVARYGPEGPSEEDEDPEDYIARVEADATALREATQSSRAPRVTHPGTTEPPEPAQPEIPNLNPRECPHLPQWKVGNRCRACNTSPGHGRARIPMRAGLRR